MKRLILLLCIWPALAAAQDENGADTAGNWVVTHQETFGIWSTLCDQRANAPDTTKRCYIRWVDVFSPRPKFGAVFLFVTAENDGLAVEFGLEPGTLFESDGFRIDEGSRTIWQTRRPGCLTGIACRFTGEQAAPLLAAMQSQGALALNFVDRHGTGQNRLWPLAGFDAAFKDFQAQRAARGLSDS